MKPGNILITKEGWIKITDLGLAKDLAAGEVTNVDTLMGTPYYMAPKTSSRERKSGPHPTSIPWESSSTKCSPGARRSSAPSIRSSPATCIRSPPGSFPMARPTPLPEPTVRLLRCLLAKDAALRPKSGRSGGTVPIRLQGTHVGSSDGIRPWEGLPGSRRLEHLPASGPLHGAEPRIAHERIPGRRVLHTTTRERMLIWVLAALFLGGCIFAYLSSR